MIRHAIVASAALAMISGAAVAGPFHKTETTVQRTAHGTIVTKRHKSLLGKMVTKRKATENTATGSSVSRSKTVTDPGTGVSKTTTSTKSTSGE
jgi:hypothetical protein